MQYFVKLRKQYKLIKESLLAFPVPSQKFLKILKYKQNKETLTENSLKCHLMQIFFFLLVFKITQFLAYVTDVIPQKLTMLRAPVQKKFFFFFFCLRISVSDILDIVKKNS